MRKEIIIICIVVLSAICACKKEKHAIPEERVQEGVVWLTPDQIKNAGIETVSATVRRIPHTVAVNGRIAYDDLKVGHVYSPVTGRVKRIFASPGDHVKKGDRLAEIISPDVGIASSDLDKANADYVAANNEFKRQKELFELHAGAKRDLEAAQDNFEKAKAERERAREKARLFQSGEFDIDKVTQNYILRAPIDGEVVNRTISNGIEVQGLYSGGTPVELFTIGDLDPVWMLADIYEMDMASIHRGDSVEVSVVAFPEQVFHGRVEWMASGLDPVTRTLKIRCTIPNREKLLRPEMYAKVSIRQPGKKALAIPRNALLRLGDQNIVFVNTEKMVNGSERFERRIVQIEDAAESSDSQFVPVLGGVTAGEKIVSAGAILLSGEAEQ